MVVVTVADYHFIYCVKFYAEDISIESGCHYLSGIEQDISFIRLYVDAESPLGEESWCGDSVFTERCNSYGQYFLQVKIIGYSW